MNSLLFQAGLAVGLLILGYLFGTIAEKRHYKKIRQREASSAHLPVIASRYPPEDRIYQQRLVRGQVVISSDYFKGFLAGLVNFFGGRVTPFEDVLRVCEYPYPVLDTSTKTVYEIVAEFEEKRPARRKEIGDEYGDDGGRPRKYTDVGSGS